MNMDGPPRNRVGRAALVLAVGGAGALLFACSDVPAPPDAPPPSPQPAPGPTPEPAPPPACDEADVLGSLARLRGVQAVSEISCGKYVRGEARCFSLTFTQRLDHAQGEKAGVFSQSARLIHRGCDRPTTIMDNGYALRSSAYDLEPSLAFQTNVLDLEHRFQGQSTPKLLADNWRYLSIENAAADMHEVIVGLRDFYRGRLVSTGASKGGITAIYHRFLHPSDLDGTIAYVAPASSAREDKRYQEWMDGASLPKRCRDDLRAFQVAALTNRRAELVAEVARRYPGSPIEPEYRLERTIAHHDWGFWQYAGDCSQVPSPEAGAGAYVAYFNSVLDGEQGVGVPGPAGYTNVPALASEWSWQQGYAEQAGAHVMGKLRTSAVDDAKNERAFQASYPKVPLPAYDGSLTASAKDWVRTSAEGVLLVYGELDPWSGGALDAPSKPTSARYFAPGHGHDAQIWHLPKPERAAAMAAAAAMYGATRSRSYDEATPGIDVVPREFFDLRRVDARAIETKRADARARVR